jgi:hypothetical protein
MAMDNSDTQIIVDWPREISLLSGYVSKEGILYDRVLVREIGGEEEELIAKKDIPPRARVEGIVINCVEKLLPAVGQTIGGEPGGPMPEPLEDRRAIRQAVIEMPANDRPHILIELRKLSPGPIFWYDVECPRERCQGQLKKFTDLRTLKLTRPKDPMLRTYDVDLGGGNVAKMKIMLGTDEALLEKLQEEHGDQFTPAIAVRTLLINGKPVEYDDIKKMGTSKRMKMRWAYERNECDVETAVRHRCTLCDKEFTVNLSIGSPDFFFPSETSNPWSTSLVSG